MIGICNPRTRRVPLDIVVINLFCGILFVILNTNNVDIDALMKNII